MAIAPSSHGALARKPPKDPDVSLGCSMTTLYPEMLADSPESRRGSEHFDEAEFDCVLGMVDNSDDETEDLYPEFCLERRLSFSHG